MGVLDAFLTTWSHARRTFGDGAPEPGAQFDSGTVLGRLHSDLESAAPGPGWTGAAADAYGAANADHRRVLAELAGLDTRMRAHIDASAQIVAAGRRELDAVHKWVTDIAAAVPGDARGDQMLYPVVKKGIGQVAAILTRSNSDLNAVGAAIRAVGAEYVALADQKFGGQGG